MNFIVFTNLEIRFAKCENFFNFGMFNRTRQTFLTSICLNSSRSAHSSAPTIESVSDTSGLKVTPITRAPFTPFVIIVSIELVWGDGGMSVSPKTYSPARIYRHRWQLRDRCNQVLASKFCGDRQHSHAINHTCKHTQTNRLSTWPNGRERALGRFMVWTGRWELHWQGTQEEVVVGCALSGAHNNDADIRMREKSGEIRTIQCKG